MHFTFLVVETVTNYYLCIDVGKVVSTDNHKFVKQDLE